MHLYSPYATQYLKQTNMAKNDVYKYIYICIFYIIKQIPLTLVLLVFSIHRKRCNLTSINGGHKLTRCWLAMLKIPHSHVPLPTENSSFVSFNTFHSRNISSMWVVPKIGGKPLKWMVKIMENPINIDDLRRKTHLFWVQHPMYIPSLNQVSMSWWLLLSLLAPPDRSVNPKGGNVGNVDSEDSTQLHSNK